jgi:hypothetical protein
VWYRHWRYANRPCWELARAAAAGGRFSILADWVYKCRANLVPPMHTNVCLACPQHLAGCLKLLKARWWRVATQVNSHSVEKMSVLMHHLASAQLPSSPCTSAYR